MYRILIVDDDKLQRKGLIHIVSWEKWGMLVVGDVSNGMLALQFLKDNPVDLAVVDVAMPVLSGLDFIKESRKLYPNLQYVVLSFHEDFEYIQQALRYGALDYISKLRMEEEDCNEVFQRVGRLLALSQEQQSHSCVLADTSGDTGEPNMPEEQLTELRTYWCSLLWIYDEEQFVRHLNAFSSSSISFRQLERLVMWVSQEIERQLGVECPSPYFSTREEGLAWLGACRETLYRRLLEMTDLTMIPVCIFRAVQYIREHITERLKAETVAHEVNMSRSYFSTIFKSHTGHTFNDYLRIERVEMAKKLLEAGPVSVSRLAAAVGYEDSKYFSRLFQQQVGVNCSEYARRFST